MEDLKKITFEEKVKAAESIDRYIALLEKQIEDAKKQIELCTPERAEIYASLLEDVKTMGIMDKQVNDLFVTYFSKEDVTWLDDSGLLAALKKNNAKEFIKTVTTTKESVDKNALKKAFKSDEALKETYKNFYGTKLTEYVTVTTEENHAKMLEHIKENAKKGE